MSASFPPWQVGQGVILKKPLLVGVNVGPSISLPWLWACCADNATNASSWHAANSSARWTVKHSLNFRVET
jgi:hypothetical protein